MERLELDAKREAEARKREIEARKKAELNATREAEARKKAELNVTREAEARKKAEDENIWLREELARLKKG